MGMSPMPRMSHPPGQMQSPLNHTISDLNVSRFIISSFGFCCSFPIASTKAVLVQSRVSRKNVCVCIKFTVKIT